MVRPLTVIQHNTPLPSHCAPGSSAATAGAVRYRGRPLDRASHEAIGIQFQATALQDFQTVAESLDMFATLYRRSAPRA
jgi:ABC-type nitrate/sulfonate/bicarbonate transport system ATPase subunit